MARWSLALALAAALLLVPERALACATCGCGDPTLTVMGAEQPFAGRLRFGLQTIGWTLDAGTPSVDRLSAAELRLDLSLAYAPLPWLFVSATMPFQAKQVTDVSLSRESAVGPGDLDLRAKAYLFRDRDFGAHHLVAGILGVALPTSPALRDREGVPLSHDAHLGTGSVAPLAGLSYSAFFDPLSLYASVTGALSTPGFGGIRPGAQVRSTLAGQYQLSTTWGLRLAVDGRWEGAAQEPDGTQDLFGAGLLVYASPDVIFSPVTDLVLQLGVRVPFLALTAEPYRPGPILALGIAYDR